MAPQTHIINRLTVDMQVSDEAQGLQLRQDFTQYLQAELTQAIDTVCGQYAGAGLDDWIQLDRLEINLGTLPGGEWKTVLHQRFEKAFGQHLAERLAALPPQARIDSKRPPEAALLANFLRTGALPWWSAPEAAPDLDALVQRLVATAPQQMRALFQQLLPHPTVLERILAQLNGTSIGALLSLWVLPSIAERALDEWIEQLILAYPTGQPLVNKKENICVRSICRALWAGKFEQITREQLAHALVEEVSQQALTSEIPQPFPLSAKMLWAVNPTIAWKTTLSNPPVSAEIMEAGDSEPSLTQWYVHQAGIILLLPFLSAFFGELGLLQGRSFRNKKAAFKALYLLYFLSTGKRKAPEFDLSLEKLLCGLALDEVIPANVTLSEQDTQEAEELLQAAISHWKALRNTSIEGFREAFLQREGILIHRGEEWHLHLERKTHDVLLDNLPAGWSISVAIVPWSDTLIHVEW